MPRSAILVLTFGLMLPADGQSDRPSSPRGTDFIPRHGSLDFVPRVSPAGGNSAAPVVSQRNGRGKFGRFGFGSPQRPAPIQPAVGRARGQATGQQGRVPARGFLLDARNVRAKEGRVPNGFGQLGLSQLQREKIYGIRALYEKHVEHLEALIERLEDEELIQCQRILTKNQRFIYQRQQAAKK